MKKLLGLSLAMALTPACQKTQIEKQEAVMEVIEGINEVLSKDGEEVFCTRGEGEVACYRNDEDGPIKIEYKIKKLENTFFFQLEDERYTLSPLNEEGSEICKIRRTPPYLGAFLEDKTDYSNLYSPEKCRELREAAMTILEN